MGQKIMMGRYEQKMQSNTMNNWTGLYETSCLICLAIILGDATDMVISCCSKFSPNFT